MHKSECARDRARWCMHIFQTSISPTMKLHNAVAERSRWMHPRNNWCLLKILARIKWNVFSRPPWMVLVTETLCELFAHFYIVSKRRNASFSFLPTRMDWLKMHFVVAQPSESNEPNYCYYFLFIMRMSVTAFPESLRGKWHFRLSDSIQFSFVESFVSLTAPSLSAFDFPFRNVQKLYLRVRCPRAKNCKMIGEGVVRRDGADAKDNRRRNQLRRWHRSPTAHKNRGAPICSRRANGTLRFAHLDGTTNTATLLTRTMAIPQSERWRRMPRNKFILFFENIFWHCFCHFNCLFMSAGRRLFFFVMLSLAFAIFAVCLSLFSSKARNLDGNGIPFGLKIWNHCRLIDIIGIASASIALAVRFY